MQEIDFLKNLNFCTWDFKMTPVVKSLQYVVERLNKEKNSCLKLVEIRKTFSKKYSEELTRYIELEDTK